jgi:hypothetical protein
MRSAHSAVCREKSLLNCLTSIFLAVGRFVDERTFDRVVDPAKMVKSYVVVAA